MFILLSFVIILGVILIFSSKRLSPVPYFPTNAKDLQLIIKALGLTNNQTIIDLGAGDGIVIFESANKALEKKVGTQFIAVEINPILILILHLRRLLNKNKKNVKIVWGDFFKLNLNTLTRKPVNTVTCYLYISPWFLDAVSKRILSQFPKAKIVSYMYPIKSLKKKEKTEEGKNTIYIYSP